MRVLSPFDVFADDARLPLLVTIGSALGLSLLAWYTTSRAKSTTKINAHKVHTLENRHFLFGDMKEVGENAERLYKWLLERSLHFNGEPWRFYLPGIMDTTVITTPELIEELLATQADIFIRGKVTNDMTEDMLGKSLISSDGPKWYHQRKAVAKFFSARALRKCMQVHLRKNVGQLNAVLDRAAQDGTPVEMMPLFQDFAMQTFAELALGIELNIIGTGKTHVMEHGIREAGPVVMRRGSVPTFWWKLERWLNIGPERKINTAMRASRAWLNKAVPESLAAFAAQRQARAEAGDTTNSDVKSMIELFLEQVDEDTEGLRAEDLPEVVLTLVIGSRGTSATSLTWYFLLMTKYPEIEQKVRDEMKSLLPNFGDDSYVSSDQLGKLVYLEATIKEMLRLYPAIPLNQRIADADTVIGGSIQVKKGDNFFLPTYAMARLPTIWGPDAAEYKPERWIDADTGELISYRGSMFQTFSTGARQCIGMRLAMLEMRVAIANILKRYRFTLAQPCDLDHKFSNELHPAQPLVLSFARNPLTPATDP